MHLVSPHSDFGQATVPRAATEAMRRASFLHCSNAQRRERTCADPSDQAYD
jgi:hypothetical protein